MCQTHLSRVAAIFAEVGLGTRLSFAGGSHFCGSGPGNETRSRSVMSAFLVLSFYKRFKKAQTRPLSLNSFTLKWEHSKQPLDSTEVMKICCLKCKNLMLKAMQTDCGHRMCLPCLGPDAETRLVRL